MKTENFFERMSAVLADAVKFIEKSAKKQKIVLFKGEPQGDEDEFYDLPTITHVSKHGFYEQFAILSVSKSVGLNENETILHTKGRGEDESLRDFKLSELNNDDAMSICFLADLIKSKIKGS